MKIGLTMIVKNESKVIERCLTSVFSAGFIDYFHIVDTGSHDDTKKIIKKVAESFGVKGVISDKPFTDFSDCRNYSLDGLRGKVDWAFWIDADEVLQTTFLFDKKELKKALKDCDYSNVKGVQKTNSMYRTSLFKIKEETIWKGLVHEYINAEGVEANVDKLMQIDIYSEGSSWTYEQKKFRSYIKMLKKMIEDEPEEPRWVYYMAESYRHMKTLEGEVRAISWYKKRMNMPTGNKEEIYVSAMMYVSLKKKTEGVVDTKILDEYKYPERIENHLIKGIYELEKGYHQRAFYTAEKTKKYWSKVPRAGIYVDSKSYCLTAPFLYAVSGHLIGKKEEVIEAISICRHSGMMSQIDKANLSMIEKSINLRNKSENQIIIDEN